MIISMSYWYKIGLLVLHDDATRFLVCEKDRKDITSDYIMPGGQMTEETVEECLKNEIKEELDCAVDFKTLQYVGEYADVAAGEPGHEVSISLYQAKLIGEPKPSAEIKQLHWIGKADEHNERVSPIIRNKIIPDLISRKILK